jgi:hypothetical protein
MRALFAISLLTLALPVPASSAPAPAASWGKAGVSLTQYRQDAVECGLQGHYTDISKTADAKAFVSASKQLDAVTTGASAPATVESSPTGPGIDNSVDQAMRYANQQAHIVESVHAEQRMRNIKKTLVGRDEQCLIQRGYSKFRLSDDQRRRLSKLKAGSDQRRAYLYGLASDPAVLQSQAVSANP